MNKISWRHHYIPKFFIKNFYNEENSLHVYDKLKEEYLPYPKSAKTIFFEKGRNNILLYNKKDDILEFLTSYSDQKLSNQLQNIKSRSKEELEDSLEFSVAIQMFITWSLWRLPQYDQKTEQYILENLESLCQIGESKFTELFNKMDEQSKIKFYRTIIPFEIVRTEPSSSLNNEVQYFKIYEHEKDAFLISDNPLIVKYHPEFKNDLNIPCFLPISSKRLYMILESNKYTVDKSVIVLINFLIINQADRYIASPDKDFLDYYIEIHKMSKNLNIIQIENFKNKLWTLVNK